MLAYFFSELLIVRVDLILIDSLHSTEANSGFGNFLWLSFWFILEEWLIFEWLLFSKLFHAILCSKRGPKLQQSQKKVILSWRNSLQHHLQTAAVLLQPVFVPFQP